MKKNNNKKSKLVKINNSQIIKSFQIKKNKKINFFPTIIKLASQIIYIFK